MSSGASKINLKIVKHNKSPVFYCMVVGKRIVCGGQWVRLCLNLLKPKVDAWGIYGLI